MNPLGVGSMSYIQPQAPEVNPRTKPRFQAERANIRLNGPGAVRAAYITMAAAKIYRPLAPSDGMGAILLSKKELACPVRLEMEAQQAARQWWADDNERRHVIRGCSNGAEAGVMYLLLRAAELCCAGNARGQIKEILQLALDDLG